MLLDPVVNLLFLAAVELVEYLCAFDRVIIRAVRGVHHVVEGDDYQNWQDVDTEESCVADVSFIAPHEHWTDQTAFVFDAVVEEVAEFLHQGRQDGHLMLVVGVVEFFYRELE